MELCNGLGFSVCDRCARFAERAENIASADRTAVRIRPMQAYNGACIDWKAVPVNGDHSTDDML